MKRTYTPRRQSKRWLDSDCPAGVLAIYDDRRTADRYTVFYCEPLGGTQYADMRIGYVGMSGAPFHPLGIGQHGELDAHQVAMYRYENRNRAAKWSSLPDDCKRLVLQDLAPENN